MPSHYCRADSTRRYLPADIRSMGNLYRMYRAAVPEPLRFGVFRKIFKTDFNIGIHQPRKDKCASARGMSAESVQMATSASI